MEETSEDLIMTNVKLRRTQRAKVERMAAKTGWTISDVVRAMIDGTEIELRPHIVIAQQGEQSTVVAIGK
jgi:hypothetical protein